MVVVALVPPSDTRKASLRCRTQSPDFLDWVCAFSASGGLVVAFLLPFGIDHGHSCCSRLKGLLRLLIGIGVTLLPLQLLSHPKGMYPSQAEAAKRAQELGCEGTHMNEGKWMPCLDEASLHQALRKQ